MLASSLGNFGLLALGDESLFELLFDGFGLIVFEVATSLLSFGLVFFPAVASLPPSGPVLLCPLNLILVFHLSSLGDG